MASENIILMRRAREALAGKWGLPIATVIINGLITGASAPLNIILSGPMALGMATFNLKLARKQNPEFEDIFKGFSNFLAALVAFLLIMVYVLLWSLLFIIPGIIAAISYSQTFYILADNPNMEGEIAMKQSKMMMEGYKAKYFRLCLRFFGWALLCAIFTLGIGLFWVMPWANLTFALFYEDINALGQPTEI